MRGTTLDFCHGKWRLQTADGSRIKNIDGWTFKGLGVHETTDLQAAVKWRRVSTAKAKRVFAKAFNKVFDLPELPPLPFLDEHQRRGVEWILTRKRSYLAHAPGAGKTAQAIVASCLLNAPGQTVFIVPPSLTENWKREIYKFTEFTELWPSIAVVPESAKKQNMRWDADFIIVPDSILARAWVQERLTEIEIKFLAVDEASRFKEVSAIRSAALYGGKRGGTDGGYHFLGLFQNAGRVVFLDGSPMLNRPMELWGPITALDPEAIDCMSMHEFGIQYCGAKINERGHWEYKFCSNAAELKQRITDRLMNVVTEDKLEHPERLRKIIYIGKDLRSADEKQFERQFLKTRNVSDLDEDASRGDLASYRRELGIKKVPFIVRHVTEKLKNSSEQILLFVWHREVAELLHQRLCEFNPGLVIGGTSNVYREAIFAEFQSGRRRLVIGNIQAVGRGHNLQRADRVIFGEYSWTDELNKQCEKRAARRGRAAWLSVPCEYIVASQTIDEPILNAVFTKVERVKRVIG